MQHLKLEKLRLTVGFSDKFERIWKQFMDHIRAKFFFTFIIMLYQTVTVEKDRKGRGERKRMTCSKEPGLDSNTAAVRTPSNMVRSLPGELSFNPHFPECNSFKSHLFIFQRILDNMPASHSVKLCYRQIWILESLSGF